MNAYLIKIVIIGILTFFYYTVFAQNEIWRLKSNNIHLYISGNVGIGTTVPDEKLTVAGKIHAEKVKIDLNVPWPDYVFQKNYPLRSLKEVECFIILNKHLADIPSAKEMEEVGICLSEMNALLQKKAEELTLYIIDHNNRLNYIEQNIKNTIKTQ